MPEAGFPQVPEPLDRGVHDRDVAALGEGNSAGEPVAVLEPEHLLQRVRAVLTPVGEHKLGRRDIGRLDALDKAAAHGLGDRVAVDHLAVDGLVVAAERSRGQAEDLRLRETVEDTLPARSGIVVTLVDEDQIEVVLRQAGEPPAAARAELLDVGHGDVRLVEIAQVCVRVQRGDERAAPEIGERSGGAIEAIGVRAVERSDELIANRQVRGNDQHPAAGDAERQQGDEAGLAAADRDLLHSLPAAAAEMRDGSRMPILLRVPQPRVTADGDLRRAEELGDLPGAEVHGAPAMSVMPAGRAIRGRRAGRAGLRGRMGLAGRAGWPRPGGCRRRINRSDSPIMVPR